MRDNAALDLGIPFSEFGGLTPYELRLRYQRRDKETVEKLDEMVIRAWWDGLFVRIANTADEYPKNLEDFLPSLAEQRAEKARKELESWTIDDCKRAVGL